MSTFSPISVTSAQALRQLLSNVNMHAHPQVVPVPNFPQFITENGVFRPNESMTTGLKGLLYELHKWAIALKTLRPDKSQEDERILQVA